MLATAAFWVLICGLSFPAQNTADCTIDAPGPLLKGSPGVKIQRVRRSPRELVETIRLRDLTAAVTQGGCTHYGVKFVFTAPSGRRDLISEAIVLTNRLKPHSDSHVVDDALAILAAADRQSYTAGEALQDRRYPDVTLYITARRGPARELELLYSFVP